MPENSIRKKHMNKFSALRAEYSASWRNVHGDITKYFFPNGGRFEQDNETPNDGRRRDEEILNSTAQTALRTLVAGLLSGAISPANRWFNLETDDVNLRETNPANQWLDNATTVLFDLLSESNFYREAETVLTQLVAYGTSAMHIDADFEKVFHFTSFIMGEYYITTNSKNQVNGLYRVLNMTAQNVVDTFGEENVSAETKEKVGEDKTGLEWIKILHVLETNSNRDVTMLNSQNMPYLSTYHEFNGGKVENDQSPLRVSGYETQPFVAPRIGAVGSDTYGKGFGEFVLGDSKQLQSMEKRKLVALAKYNEPPLVMNAASGAFAINSGANGATWVGGVSQNQGPAAGPLYQVQTPIGELREEIASVEDRLETSMLSKLFFLISSTDKGDQTATEIRARENEKLRLLGPIMEHLQPEFVNPSIERVFDLAFKAGKLGDPPEELVGKTIKIKLISPIAQAQRLATAGPIEQVYGYVERVAQTYPQVMDKFNAEQSVDELGIAHGIATSVIRSDDEVLEIRAKRELAAQQAQQAEAAAQQVDGAKTLSDTQMGTGSALDSLLDAAGGA